MKLPQMIRNLWIYRRLIGLTVLLGVVVSFVFSNWSDVEVKFPLFGTIKSSVGVVMLVSAALGSIVTWLIMTIRQAWRDAHNQRAQLNAETTAMKPVEMPAKSVESETAKQSSEGPASAGP